LGLWTLNVFSLAVVASKVEDEEEEPSVKKPRLIRSRFDSSIAFCM